MKHWTEPEDWPPYGAPTTGQVIVHDWETREDALKARLVKLGEDIERFIKRGCRA
jgi:hypothetical protein